MLTTCLRLPATSSWLCTRGDTAEIAVSNQPALLVKHLEIYFSNLERWLSEWRIVIISMLFAKAGRRVSKPRPVQLFGEPIHWVDTACYLGMTFDKRRISSTHIDQVRKKVAQRLGGAGTSPKQQKRSVHQEWRSAI